MRPPFTPVVEILDSASTLVSHVTLPHKSEWKCYDKGRGRPCSRRVDQRQRNTSEATTAREYDELIVRALGKVSVDASDLA